MFTGGVKSAGRVRQQSEKRREVANMFTKKKERRKKWKKVFWSFSVWIFCLPFSTTAEQFDLYCEGCGKWTNRFPHLAATTLRQPKTTTQRKAEKTVRGRSLDSRDNHSQKRARLTTTVNHFVFRHRLMRPSSLSCDSLADIVWQISDVSDIGRKEIKSWKLMWLIGSMRLKKHPLKEAAEYYLLVLSANHFTTHWVPEVAHCDHEWCDWGSLCFEIHLFF